jgi:DNA gyrase subunit A
MLKHFLDFRERRVTAPRVRAGRAARAIHLLEGFEKVFDALDEMIKIIRKSEGKGRPRS